MSELGAVIGGIKNVVSKVEPQKKTITCHDLSDHNPIILNLKIKKISDEEKQRREEQANKLIIKNTNNELNRRNKKRINLINN